MYNTIIYLIVFNAMIDVELISLKSFKVLRKDKLVHSTLWTSIETYYRNIII